MMRAFQSKIQLEIHLHLFPKKAIAKAFTEFFLASIGKRKELLKLRRKNSDATVKGQSV